MRTPILTMALDMFRRSTVLLISLFAYLWTATSLGETLLIHQLAAHHNETTVPVLADGGRELVFHRAGHQDSHEPGAIDLHAHEGHPAADADDGHHGDPVVALDNDLPTTVSLSKNAKFSDLLLALPTVSYLVSLAELPLVLHALYPLPQSRNSSLATQKLTRLLI